MSVAQQQQQPLSMAEEEEVEEVELDEFDPRSIRPLTATIAFFGSRGSGKSTAMESLLFELREQVPAAVVFSPTEKQNKHFQKFIPDSFIYDTFEPEQITRLLNRQANVKKSPPWPGFNPTLVIVFDDCMSDKKVWGNKAVRTLFLEGRHYETCVLLGIQYFIDLPLTLRQQIDYMFFTKERNAGTLKKIYAAYFTQFFPHFDEFARMYTHYTADHGLLVYNVKSSSPRMRDVVSTYRARYLKQLPWRLDYYPDMWLKHEACYLDASKLEGGGAVNWHDVNAGRHQDVPVLHSSASSSSATAVIKKPRAAAAKSKAKAKAAPKKKLTIYKTAQPKKRHASRDDDEAAAEDAGH